MPTCGRCNGKGAIQPFKALAPTRCPVCLGLKTIAAKRKKNYPDPQDKGLGVWLHINEWEGVTYMSDTRLTTAELNRLLGEQDGTTSQETERDRSQRTDTQDVDANPDDSTEVP